MRESEWQPAVVVSRHGSVKQGHWFSLLVGVRVRVRPIKNLNWITFESRIARVPEDSASRFFQVHPEDAKIPEPNRAIVCEHEILTD